MSYIKEESFYFRVVKTLFLNGLCNVDRFILELSATLPTVVFIAIEVNKEYAEVWTTNSLSPTEKATINAVASYHTGGKVPAPVMLSSSRLKEEEFIISNDTEWQMIAGTIARPAFFHEDVSQIVAQVVGQFNILGDGAQIKIVEVCETMGNVEMLPAYDLEPTNGLWRMTSFGTVVPPRTGMFNYKVLARLNGATHFSLRYTSMSMLKVV